MVVGLGRFGTAVAESLIRMGHEVLGVDEDAERVQRLSDQLTHTVQADTTDVETLRQLGACDFASAVVGIGSDVEASVLTTLALVDLGVPTMGKSHQRTPRSHPGANRRAPCRLSRSADGRAGRAHGDRADDRLYRIR